MYDKSKIWDRKCNVTRARLEKNTDGPVTYRGGYQPTAWRGLGLAWAWAWAWVWGFWAWDMGLRLEAPFSQSMSGLGTVDCGLWTVDD